MSSTKFERGYLTIGLVIALGVVSLAGIGLWNRLGAAQEETAKVKGEFAVFKAGVEKIGEQAKKDKAAALKNQKEAHDATVKDWSERLYHLGVKYELLRKLAGNTGGGGVPAVPDTTPTVDDAARDNRLLEVLRFAEIQTLQLIHWQEWADANKDSCGVKK
jgi:hypothetical protein